MNVRKLRDASRQRETFTHRVQIRDSSSVAFTASYVHDDSLFQLVCIALLLCSSFSHFSRRRDGEYRYDFSTRRENTYVAGKSLSSNRVKPARIALPPSLSSFLFFPFFFALSSSSSFFKWNLFSTLKMDSTTTAQWVQMQLKDTCFCEM